MLEQAGPRPLQRFETERARSSSPFIHLGRGGHPNRRGRLEPLAKMAKRKRADPITGQSAFDWPVFCFSFLADHSPCAELLLVDEAPIGSAYIESHGPPAPEAPRYCGEEERGRPAGGRPHSTLQECTRSLLAE